MSRLIDADRLKREFPKDSDWEYPVNTNEYVCEVIDAQPEIVRCKDCIYYDKGYDEDTADWCHAWSEATSVEGYCHNAERGGEQDGLSD